MAESEVEFSKRMKPSELASWLPSWLDKCGVVTEDIPELCQKLIRNKIGGASFLRLDDPQMAEMGLVIGERNAIKDIIAEITKPVKQTMEAVPDIDGDITVETAVLNTSHRSSNQTRPVVRVATDGGLPDVNLTILQEAGVITQVAAKWHQVGIFLAFDADGKKLDEITADYGGKGARACCEEMFKYWLVGNGKKVSWDTVEKFLRNVGEIAFADSLMERVQAAT